MTPTRRRAATRRASRGAAIVEALIVLSMMTVFLGGMIYMEQIYEQQLTAQRLAASTAMAYGLNGCPAGLGGAGTGANESNGARLDTAAMGLSTSLPPGVVRFADHTQAPLDTAMLDEGFNASAGAEIDRAPTPPHFASGATGFGGSIASTSYAVCADVHPPLPGGTFVNAPLDPYPINYGIPYILNAY